MPPMQVATWQVREVATSGGLVQVTCAGAWHGYAGQAVLAAQPDQPLLGRTPLYPHAAPDEPPCFWVAPTHPYARLAPGAALEMLGPVGRGFRWPPNARHLLLLATALENLLGLMHAALAQQLAVTVLTPRRLSALPPEVEVQRGPLTAELVHWADLVALDVADPLTTAKKVRALAPHRSAAFVQALFHTPLPCGFGACQACWIDLPAGKKLACETGIVDL